ncbi:spherulation-specific family 4 protein [Metarhizium robertsii]|uniref:Spherulation-specific family 4 n=2 Tax=Metarhizium robertsii TaxID=568076 RepID=E9F0N5_METRA|nr:Spherulation-specific family 4 [Metarhizium robertsii ARSEF 23]EFY98695.1 Spherulation-specific family 4 [Metarhizium robertsii ARSEF 23]EXV04149.1 spherulation-specific family 4 protein [Metarhizium robertsii]
MRLLLTSALATTVSATGLILPLYIYPAATWDDGAANWTPVFNAAESNLDLSWLTVVNPHNGPGDTHLPGNNDINYIQGVTKLNTHPNIKPIGYVRTNYAQFSLDQVKQDVAAWKGWDTYSASNISVQGIFFDESAPNAPYMSDLVGYTRAAFGRPITVTCNFGKAVSDEFYDICDVVVAFESCLNCPGLPQYKDAATIQANIPASRMGKAAVILNYFTGTAFDGTFADATLVHRYFQTARDMGLAWAYFCSQDYNDILAWPATIWEDVKALS